jgi:hypothetical protein
MPQKVGVGFSMHATGNKCWLMVGYAPTAAAHLSGAHKGEIKGVE